MWDLLIRNGHLVTPHGVQKLDLAVEGGAIVDVAAELQGSARETIDATGLHVFPGVIDPHVHFNEPGRTEWEGFSTGTAALAAGGGTCFFDMPLNSSPPTLDGESFDLKLAAAKQNSRTDFALWGGLTPKNLDRMEELAERGVIGFKAFMSGSGIDDFERADDVTLQKGMKIASRLGRIVAVHAEDEAWISGLMRYVERDGRTGWRAYLDSRPIEAEVEAIHHACQRACQTNCQLHVVHISSSAGIAKREWAREFLRNPDVSTETCPHYLLLNEEDLVSQGAPAKCAPPLRSQAEVERLRCELFAGRIDIVGSDHSPAPASMKTGDNAFNIWGGISGVQSTLSALLTIGVLPAQAARLTSSNVADRFGVARKGRIATGFDADLALVDTDASYTLTRDMLLDRHKLSPYVGRTFKGLVKRTIVRGHTVFRDGRIVDEGFRGQLVRPTR